MSQSFPQTVIYIYMYIQHYWAFTVQVIRLFGSLVYSMSALLIHLFRLVEGLESFCWLGLKGRDIIQKCDFMRDCKVNGRRTLCRFQQHTTVWFSWPTV